MTMLIAGVAGFTRSNFVLDWLAQSNEPVVNLDLLTYTGNLENLKEPEGDPRHQFVRGNIDARKLEKELGWKPQETFETGIRKTVQWYLDNQDWVNHVASGEYCNWVEKRSI